MKNRKVLIIILIILILVLIIAGIFMIIILKGLEEQKKNITPDNTDVVLEKDTSLSPVENKSIIFTLEGYLKESLSIDNNIYIWKAYLMEKVSNDTYFIQIISNAKATAFVVINVDYGNNAYEIIPITEKEFNDGLNGKIEQKYIDDVTVENNGKNNLKYTYLKDEEIGEYYFKMIKDLIMNYPEMIYERLTEEYKEKKFNKSYQTFTEYCNERKEFVDTQKMNGCATSLEDEKRVYECRDTSYNIYKIIEENAAEFKIELDDYTLYSEEILKLYNQADSNTKVATCLEQFIKVVNNQDYDLAYKYLNEDFKNNKFPTRDLYKQYLQQEYHRSNIFTINSIVEQGQYFIVTFGIRKGDTMTTEEDVEERKVAIKISEDIKFEMAIVED